MDGGGDQQQRMHRQGDPPPDRKTSGGELCAPLDVLPQGEQEGASRRGAYGRAGHEPCDGPPRVERLTNGAIEDGRGVAAAMGQPQRHAVQGLHEDRWDQRTRDQKRREGLTKACRAARNCSAQARTCADRANTPRASARASGDGGAMSSS